MYDATDRQCAAQFASGLLMLVRRIFLLQRCTGYDIGVGSPGAQIDFFAPLGAEWTVWVGGIPLDFTVALWTFNDHCFSILASA
jgi:hypothetical protein